MTNLLNLLVILIRIFFINFNVEKLLAKKIATNIVSNLILSNTLLQFHLIIYCLPISTCQTKDQFNAWLDELIPTKARFILYKQSNVMVYAQQNLETRVSKYEL